MNDTHLLSRRRKTPTQERGERRVADLLRAAEQIFSTVGYDAATMSGIAQLAGASIGSLYQFFPNKESIGGALLLEYMNDLSRQLDEWKDDLPDSLVAFGRDLIALVFDYTAQRPACRILSETPSVPRADGMEMLCLGVQGLLSTFAPAAMKQSGLSTVALAVSLMVRAAVQGSRMVDPKKGAAMRREMQDALGIYLEARLSPARLGASVPKGTRASGEPPSKSVALSKRPPVAKKRG
jgi:AcrR family transcriptional regulator